MILLCILGGISILFKIYKRYIFKYGIFNSFSSKLMKIKFLKKILDLLLNFFKNIINLLLNN